MAEIKKTEVKKTEIKENKDVIDLTASKEAIRLKIKERKNTLGFFIENEKAIAKARAK